MSRPRVQKKPAPRRLALPLLFLGGVGVVAAVAAAANPSGVIAALGMLPTIIVFVLDRSEDKATTCAIGGMNSAGVIPFMPSLWAQGRWPGMAAGMEDILAFTAMYGAAICGWGLVALLPMLVDAVERTVVARRCRSLRIQQRELVKAWGPEVRGELPLPPADGS